MKLIGQISDVVRQALGNQRMTELFSQNYYPGIHLTETDICELCSGIRNLEEWAAACIGPGLNLELMNDLAASLYASESEDAEEDAMDDGTADSDNDFTEADADRAAGPVQSLAAAADNIRYWSRVMEAGAVGLHSIAEE